MSKWNNGISYARVGGERVNYKEGYYKLLDLSGNTNIDYYIHFNNAGQVTEFYVTDKQFQYIYFGNNKPLAKEDIKPIDIGTDGKVNGDAALNGTIAFQEQGKSTGGKVINSGVITIADAISYSEDWSRLEITEVNGTVTVALDKYNKGTKKSE